jgi:non-homologous end joining protein Ku
MKDFMVLKDDELERLEEEIKENIEWLSTIDDDEIECIGIENLESILTRFFNRTITLRHIK